MVLVAVWQEADGDDEAEGSEMIRHYSIHRTDRLITGFELCSAVIISLLLGWIFAGSFGIVVDVYECPFNIQRFGGE